MFIYTQNMVLFISHNTTSFYSLFIQADNMFQHMFLGHLQVTRNVCLEEVIQVSHEIKYVVWHSWELISFLNTAG